MALSVDQIRQKIGTMLPIESDMRPLIVAINQVMLDIRGFKSTRWSFDLAHGYLDMVATYSTGTLTATNGSTALVGSGTLWDTTDNALAGDRFIVEGVDYEVATVTDDTNIVLNTNFVGAGGAGLSYARHRPVLALASDVKKVLRIWDQTNQFRLHAESIIALEDSMVVHQETGDLLRYSMYERSSTDVKQIIFRPYPTALAKLVYLYEKEYTKVTAVDDNVDIVDELEDVVIQGVYARMFALQTNNSPQSQMEKQVFFAMLDDAWQQDQELSDLIIRFARQDRYHSELLGYLRIDKAAAITGGP